MSYCFNPACQTPQNPADTEFCQSCGSKLLLTVGEATSQGARYRVLHPIGQGGFGRTFLAVDENKPFNVSRCVIKQFFPQGIAPEKAASLFQQEAVQLESLGKHPQIPALLEYFQEGGQQYLVQEFIEGKNLAQELAQKGVFTEPQIRQLLNELLPVLHFVHKSKVIHRDIKPENIIRRVYTYQDVITGFIPLSDADLPATPPSLFREGGLRAQLVLVDFGAAKKVLGNGLPQTGTIIGSAAYTAPEQLMGKAVYASDLYSLGVTCIHLLTNVPPFDLFDSQEGNWIWRDYLKSPVSDDLGSILNKMLQGATNRRYHAATAILRQLHPKPVYLDTLPSLTVAETPDRSEVPAPIAPVAPPPLPPPPKRPESISIQEALQEALAPYQVRVQVHLAKQRLTVVINRNEDNSIYYPHISQIVSAKLTDLKLQRIMAVKLLGRVNGNRVPEWQQILRLDTKIQLRNKIIRLQNNQLALQTLQMSDKNYWISQLKNRNFWIDCLMFALVSFIFSSKVIILNPWFALAISSGFIGVKNLNARTQTFQTNNLFATIACVFLLVGILIQNSIFVTGPFGVLLACLFVSLPIFYVSDGSANF